MTDPRNDSHAEMALIHSTLAYLLEQADGPAAMIADHQHHATRVRPMSEEEYQAFARRAIAHGEADERAASVR